MKSVCEVIISNKINEFNDPFEPKSTCGSSWLAQLQAKVVSKKSFCVIALHWIKACFSALSLMCCAAGCGRWPSLCSRRGTCLDSAARWRNGTPEGGGAEGGQLPALTENTLPYGQSESAGTDCRPFSIMLHHRNSSSHQREPCFAPTDMAECHYCILNSFSCFFKTKTLIFSTNASIGLLIVRSQFPKAKDDIKWLKTQRYLVCCHGKSANIHLGEAVNSEILTFLIENHNSFQLMV